MRKYETLVVLRPDLEEGNRNSIIEKFKEIISKEGEVTNINEWGNKKLAYEIEKLREGYYILVEYNAKTTLPKEFERNLKINEEVLRYMTVNRD
ncbi:MAG: 30S ribosomal protein S6 [Clostridiales bacterium]|nr:MAG: 30S ribosomal protein S6 [Clostridiales bacterium]